MFSHLFSTLHIGFLDIPGALRHAYTVLNEPVILLSVFGLSVIPRKFASNGVLVVMFGAISFVEGALIDLHPGGNINYFYEALFAFVPAAALGIIHLLAIIAAFRHDRAPGYCSVPDVREAENRIRRHGAAGGGIRIHSRIRRIRSICKLRGAALRKHLILSQ